MRPAAEYDPGNDEPNNPDGAQQLADAQSAIFGWVEASDVIDDPGEWVRAGYELTGLIEELNASGWTVYGALVPERLIVGDRSMPWSTAIVCIKRTPHAKVA